MAQFQVMSVGKERVPENSWAGCLDLQYIHNTFKINTLHPDPSQIFVWQRRKEYSWAGCWYLQYIYIPHAQLFYHARIRRKKLSVCWGIERCRGFYHTLFRYTWDISLGLVAVTFCAPIPSTICEKLKDDIFLDGLVDVRFQSTASSCKLSAALHSVFQHQNREDCHIFVWGGLWEEEDNIFKTVIFHVSYL